MKFSYLVLSLSLISPAASGATRSQFFFGGRALVMITAKSQTGQADDDGARLYKGMNVEERDSLFGPGKAVASSAGDFSLSCTVRQGIGTECSLVVNQSTDMTVDESAGRIDYHVTGERADVLSARFLLSDAGRFEYETHDGRFIITAAPGSFRFNYTK